MWCGAVCGAVCGVVWCGCGVWMPPDTPCGLLCAATQTEREASEATQAQLTEELRVAHDNLTEQLQMARAEAQVVVRARYCELHTLPWAHHMASVRGLGVLLADDVAA